MRPSLLLPLTALVACGPEAAPQPEAELLSEIVDLDGQRTVMPAATLELGDGTAVDFFVWEDGSVGMRGRGGASTVLPDLLAASGDSPAEVFWGLSAPGTPIPAAIRDIQAELPDRPAWDDVVAAEPQGWMHELPRFRTYAPCVNSTFQAAHCLPNASYDHGVCVTDHTANIAWYTAAVRRYHASFCLDQGTVNETLTYSELQNASTCTYWLSFNAIWGGLGGNTYSANTYFTWTWIAPSSAMPRAWDHVATGVSGADRLDWAFMQVLPGICG